MSFGAVLAGNSIRGGADQDTLNFAAGVNASAIVSGDAGSDVFLFSSTVATAGVYGVQKPTAWCLSALYRMPRSMPVL